MIFNTEPNPISILYCLTGIIITTVVIWIRTRQNNKVEVEVIFTVNSPKGIERVIHTSVFFFIAIAGFIFVFLPIWPVLLPIVLLFPDE